MIIDLNNLNRFGKLNLDDDFSLDEVYYKNTDIRELKNLHIDGEVEIDYDDNIYLNLNVKGIMILPCAISLEDVEYSFSTTIDETIGNFEEIYKNNKNSLDISNILWENIVLEIPIRVVAKNIKPSNTHGDGWELIS